MRVLRTLTLGALLATVPFPLTVGCRQQSGSESTEARDLTKKVAEVEKAESQTQGATKAQAEAMAKAGIKPGTEEIALTQAQRTLLEQRVKAEKDNSTAALLQEILDRDQLIADLDGKLAKLRTELPRPVIAKANDNHFTMAVRFLKGQGLSDAKAKVVAARANLMEELQPGWQVYNQYLGGVYLTAVSQGRASVGPTEFVRNQRAALERERADNIQIAQGLKAQVEVLEAQRQKVQEEVDSLQTEKVSLMGQVTELTALSQTQKAKLNALHYMVGYRKQLESEGLIVVPVFARDRMGPKAVAAKFDRDLPLDSPSPEVVIRASELGLQRIGKVNVIPGSLEKNKHYSLVFSEDRANAVIRILDADRLRNDRVVFAVSD